MKESLFNMLRHNFREIIAVSVIYTVSFINCFIKKNGWENYYNCIVTYCTS